MKVKCIMKGNNPKFPKLNAIYNVFGIDFFLEKTNQEIMISIYSDIHDSPVLEQFKNFEIVDSRIPSDWIFRKSKYINTFFIQPKEFSSDFWDKYHDGDPEAEKIFQEVERKIKLFHGDKLEDLSNMDAEFSAQAIGDNWVLCPKCSEAFEVDSDERVVRCPNRVCNVLLNNPLFSSN